MFGAAVSTLSLRYPLQILLRNDKMDSATTSTSRNHVLDEEARDILRVDDHLEEYPEEEEDGRYGPAPPTMDDLNDSNECGEEVDDELLLLAPELGRLASVGSDDDEDTGDDYTDDYNDDDYSDDDDTNDVSMDAEVDLTPLREELAAATVEGMDETFSSTEVVVHRQHRQYQHAATNVNAAVATPVKPAQKTSGKGTTDKKKDKDKDSGGTAAAAASPAKSLATQGTMDVSASDEDYDYDYDYDYDDTFHEGGGTYGGCADVEAGRGGRDKRRTLTGSSRKKNMRNKKKKKKKRKNKTTNGGCCDRQCPTRCRVLGFVAFLAVMVGAVAYLFLGGEGGGPIWMSSASSNQAIGSASATNTRGGSEGTLGVISTYTADAEGETEDPETTVAVYDDDDDDAAAPNVPAGCTDDGTWRLMRRDTTGTHPGGVVLSADGCEFVATHPSRHCGKSGLALVETGPSTASESTMGGGVSSSSSASQVTMMASEACPVSCDACEEYLEAKEAAAAAVVVETASPTAFPTTPGPTANPTPPPTSAPTAPPTVPIVLEVEREGDEFYYDWDAVIAEATYDCPDPETVLGEDLFDSREEAGKVDTRLGEASGLASSRIHPGVLYTHEDYKDLNEFYAIDADEGDVVGDFVLVGATNRDYEDISVGPGPVQGASYVYIGDVGDNWEKRLDIKIYRVKESLLRIGVGVRQEITDFDTLTLTYHDGAPHNSEAFYFDPVDHLIYIIRKEGGKMWRTPTKWGPGDATMTLVRDVDIGSNPNQIIAGVDMSPDGREVLIKYYGAVRYYCRKPGQSMTDVLSTAEPITLPYTREPRGEAVAFAANRAEGYYTLSENNGDNKEQPLYNYQRIVDSGNQEGGKQQKEEKGKR